MKGGFGSRDDVRVKDGSLRRSRLDAVRVTESGRARERLVEDARVLARRRCCRRRLKAKVVETVREVVELEGLLRHRDGDIADGAVDRVESGSSAGEELASFEDWRGRDKRRT